MVQRFSNFASAKLTAPIGTGDASLTIESSKADRFPVATGADWFKVVLEDASANREIVRAKRASGSSSLTNLVRAQDGTTALAFTLGSIVSHRVVAADIENALAAVFPDGLNGNLNLPTEVEVASGATIDVGAAASRLVRVTGAAGPVTSLGNTYQGPVWMRFQQAVEVQHGAALLLPGGKNLRTMPERVYMAYPKATGAVKDGWMFIPFDLSIGQLQYGLGVSFVSAGTATAYTGAPEPALIDAAEGQLFHVEWHADNTSVSPTLAISGKAAKALKFYGPDGTKVAPVVGEIKGGATALVLDDGTDYVILGMPAASRLRPQVWEKRQAGKPLPVTYNPAGNTLDFAEANNFHVTPLTGNLTLSNPTNAEPGQSGVIRLVQDGTGGRTMAWGGAFKGANGQKPPLAAGANAVTILTYYVVSSTEILVGGASGVA